MEDWKLQSLKNIIRAHRTEGIVRCVDLENVGLLPSGNRLWEIEAPHQPWYRALHKHYCYQHASTFAANGLWTCVEVDMDALLQALSEQRSCTPADLLLALEETG